MPKKIGETFSAPLVTLPRPVVRPPPVVTKLARNDEFSTGRAMALRERSSKSMPVSAGTAVNSTAPLLKVGAFGTVVAPVSGSTPAPLVAAAAATVGESTPAPLVATAAATVGESTPAPVVATAAAAVEAAFGCGDPAAAAIELERQVKAHPAEAEQIIRASQPTIARVAQAIGADRGNEANLQALVSLSAAASSAGPAGTAIIATELAATIPDGNLERIDDGFTQAILAGAGPELALKTSELMKATRPRGANDVLNATVEAVDKLREDYTRAADENAALEARLAQDLSTFGAAMTPAERQKYTEAFWATPERLAVKNRVAALGDQLSQTLASAGPALEAAALAGHEGAGEALIDAYEQLGRCPEHAAEAISWVGRVGVNPALFQKLDGFGHDNLETRFKEKLLANAIPLAQEQILAAHVDDPSGSAAQNALTDLEALLGPLANSCAFSSIGTEVRTALAQTRAFVSGDFSSAQALADGFDSANPFTQALGVAAISQGVFAQPEGSDGLATLGTILGRTGTGLNLAARLLKTFAGTAQFTANFGNFAAKIAPGLALIANIIQLKGDIDNLRDDPNAGEFIAAFGSLLGAAGGAASYFFPPAALVLGVAGTALHAIGDLVSNLITGNEERRELLDDQAQLFQQATGLDFGTARELIQAQPRALTRLSELGLTPEQIRTLATEDNVDFASPESWVAIKAAALFGLEGAEVAQVVDMLCGDGRFTYAENPLTWVFTTMDNPGSEASRQLWDQGNFGPMQAEILDILRRENPEAAAYLEAHQGTPSLEVFGPFSYTQFE